MPMTGSCSDPAGRRQMTVGCGLSPAAVAVLPVPKEMWNPGQPVSATTQSGDVNSPPREAYFDGRSPKPNGPRT